MLLEVQDLSVEYIVREGVVKAVDGASFEIDRGEILGIVGESGCGKSTVAKTIVRVLPENGRVIKGRVLFNGVDLMKLSELELNKIRWRKISMIPQNAMNALDPVYRVGDQVLEAILSHEKMSVIDARKRVVELFELVGLERKRLESFPHQLSGGQRQRVVIAMALALNPELIIADEPTTGLDVVTQDSILHQIEILRNEFSMSVILITHDVALVAEACDKVAVMYGGKIVEYGPTHRIFKEPYHPYTLGLKNAFPDIREKRLKLMFIPGSPPNLLNPPLGCPFAERCPFVIELCKLEEPPLREIGDMKVKCHRWYMADEFRVKAKEELTWGIRKLYTEATMVREKSSRKPVLEVKNVKKFFPIKRGLLGALLWKPYKYIRAVDGVSLELMDGEILGLAGESGAGKTTLGELCLLLQPLSEGAIFFNGKDIFEMMRHDMKGFREKSHMVFQNPYEALNPRFKVFDIVSEPLKIFKVREEETINRVKEALRWVGLTPPENYLSRYPHQLSGGERQRVAVARSLILKPRLLIADEPVSMLDVSVRAGILELLMKARAEFGTAIIYISHDISTIKDICDRVAIMYLGRIVEVGPTDKVVRSPKHPYTRVLISAIPVPDPEFKRRRVIGVGEIPDPIDLPCGCRFHPRCPSASRLCGWDSRDLLNFIMRKCGDELLKKVKRIRAGGYSLKIVAKENAKSLLREFLDIISGTIFEDVLANVSIVDNIIQFTLFDVKEPELKEVEEGWYVACHYA